jgi:hypothetical protein
MKLITGNTYKVKDQLRSLGGQWDPAAKGWQVPDAQAGVAQALVDNATYGGGGIWSSRWPRKTCQTCGSGIKYGLYCGKCEYAS